MQAQDFAALKAKADAGDVAAQLEVARDYEAGHGVNADAYEAAAWYKKAAEHDNAEAQNSLGVKYRTGEGVPKDLEIAVKWYRMAAKLGDANAMFNLGAAYYNGDGVPIDDVTSLAWFSIASEFGSSSAPDAVKRGLTEISKPRVTDALEKASDMLVDGESVPVHRDIAVKLLNRAIDMGSTQAMLRMANIYLTGKGGERDFATAFKYCQSGANEKLAAAMACLGGLYQAGSGVPADVGKAMEWYQKAADCGDAESMVRLARIYQDGTAIPQDKPLAFSYYLVAGLQIPAAKTAAAALKPQLDKKAIDRGEKRAREIYIKALQNRGKCVF
jgi:hypothetical protein